MHDAMPAALREVESLHGREAELWRPVLRVLPVTGASISIMASTIGAETVAASDSLAARIDEMQMDLGEGPCWDAMRSSSPVLEPDIQISPIRTWPNFARAISEVGVGAMFAFPLTFGPLKLGAMDLYTESASHLDTAEVAQGSSLANAISRVVLDRAVRLTDVTGEKEDQNPYSRRLIHQATGMVLAQLDIDAEDARLLIHAHAFAVEKSVREIADDILQRRLNFDQLPTGIETSHE